MRNLKRALSLALASVMLLGMMVVGTSAASYPDVDEKDNVEAIEVLNAAKVMIGEQGNFNPDAPVNRHAMAVIMAKLYLGVETADSYVGSHPFTDVVPWADKYVAACYENGLVSGTSATTYGGNQPLTAVQAAAMMLRALGYKDLSKGATDWRAPVTSMANQIRLFNGVASNPSEKLTRNQVAQLALNTLKSPVVTLKDNTFDVTSGDGSIVISGGSREYIVRFSREDYAYAINDTETSGDSASGIQGATIELGEHLYNGKLKLNNNAHDDFGRPARRWEYDGKVVGTYEKKELLRKEYTAKVTGKDLYELLGKDIIDSVARGGNNDYVLNITIDGYPTEGNRTLLGGAYFTEGSMTRTNTDKVGDTGKGTLTQVYVDGAKKIVDISIINTYLAKATQNYVSKDESVKMDIYEIDNARGRVKTDDQKNNKIVNGDDLPLKDVKKDDIYLVTISQGEVITMAKPEVVADTVISSFKVGNWVKNSEVQYDYADTAMYDVEVLDEFENNNMKNLTYNVILDKYGYMIGIEQNETVNQYAFLTGMELGGSNLAYKNAQANLIFVDGTMQTVTVNTEKSKPIELVGGHLKSVEGGNWTYNGTDGTDPTALRPYSQLNTWCTYTKDDNNVYTLNEVGVNSQLKRADDVSKLMAVYKVAQASEDADDFAGDKFDINTKNVSRAGADTPDYAKVYGNDESVYINVELKNVTDKENDDVKIINKVKSTTVGIKNVDMTVSDVPDDTYTAPGDEVFTLYNKDGYIIAAITLEAEDNGASANYAYIVSDVKMEADLGGSKYAWEQDAIVNGKLVTLREVGDTRSSLNLTTKGLWYEITYDKDGNVNGIKSEYPVGTKAPIYFDTDYDKYLNDMNEIEDALNNRNGFTDTEGKTLLLNVAYCTSPRPEVADPALTHASLSYKNGTLFTDNDQEEGLWVSPNVKTVVCLSGGLHKDPFDTITDTYEGRDGLEQALEDLYEGDNEFDGYLSAIIDGKNGATVIILDERSGKVNGNLEPLEPMSVVLRLRDQATNNVLFTITDSNVRTDKNYGKPNAILAGSSFADKANWTAVDNSADVTVDYVEVKGGGHVEYKDILYKSTIKPTMLVEVTFMDGSTPVGSKVQKTVEEPDSGWTVDIIPGDQAAIDAETANVLLPAGYAIKTGSPDSETIAFAEKTVAKVSFQVMQVVNITKVAADGSETTETVDKNKTIAEVVGLPSNAKVFAKYQKDGEAAKAEAGNGSTKVAEGMKIWMTERYVPLTTDAVTVSATKPTGTGTISVDATIKSGVETINTAKYIKIGNVEIDAKITTNDAADDTLTGNLNMAVTGTANSAEIGTISPAALAGDNLTIPTGADGKTVTITVPVSLPEDITDLTADTAAFTLTFSA